MSVYRVDTLEGEFVAMATEGSPSCGFRVMHILWAEVWGFCKEGAVTLAVVVVVVERCRV